ncbi:MAG: VOC family protein [Verrucomicrobia bacterium]|nr:VOC family protein [Verrucomicrobiota bacterium]
MSAPVRKFHLSLNVSDLTRSVAFYRVLFGLDPAKHHADYAKFEVESPPTVFSLIPGRAGGGGSLNHVGLCLLDSEELVAIQLRLEQAGHKTLREDGVACCYSRQTKFWVRDPDGVLLELYVFHEDLDDHGDHHAPESELPTLMGGEAEAATPAVTWTHRLGEALTLPLAQDAFSVQEVVLEGTLNATGIDLPALLREALRILKPGGTISLHGLVADRPLVDSRPALPGPAAVVQFVPDFPSLAPLLVCVGFRNARFTKLSEKGYFEAEGVPLREVLISAVKPGFRSAKKDQTVVYLGPQNAVEDDFGNRFVKGSPVALNMHDWQSLKNTAASSFALLQPLVETPNLPTHSMSTKARYIMIGGFLGAGKTTTVGRLAKHLSDQGLRVGLITNDQAGGLVDTKLLRGQGYATEEIAGGCFCCRFNTLVDAASKLANEAKPDVFIAEPVGSCTDLVATVTYPLRRMYGDAFTVAPLSVLVDPIRARRVFGLDQGGTFSAKVAYIFKKQLEEADIIVISKSDLVEDAQREDLRAVLAKEFPLAKIVIASPRQETGLDELFASLMTDEQARRNPMAVDYEVYADGEALLGWLNATVTLKADDEFDANAFLKQLALIVQARLQQNGAEIAHFKMTFSPDDGIAGELASINLVRSDYVAELGMELDEPTTGGQLIVNLRAEADPASLMEAVKDGLAEATLNFFGLKATLDHEEHFRPGKPTPTHRDGEVVMETKGGCKPGSSCC